MLAVAVERKDARDLAQAAVEVRLEVIDESEHEPSLVISVRLIEQLPKQSSLPGTGPGYNQLLPACGCENALNGLFELTFNSIGFVGSGQIRASTTDDDDSTFWL